MIMAKVACDERTRMILCSNSWKRLRIQSWANDPVAALVERYSSCQAILVEGIESVIDDRRSMDNFA
jgi:hypothetical protein